MCWWIKEIVFLAEHVWQYFIAVPDVKSVGVRDGKRYEGWPAIIQAVNTTDAHWTYQKEIKVKNEETAA